MRLRRRGRNAIAKAAMPSPITNAAQKSSAAAEVVQNELPVVISYVTASISPSRYRTAAARLNERTSRRNEEIGLFPFTATDRLVRTI